MTAIFLDDLAWAANCPPGYARVPDVSPRHFSQNHIVYLWRRK